MIIRQKKISPYLIYLFYKKKNEKHTVTIIELNFYFYIIYLLLLCRYLYKFYNFINN
jgi:hypothetical protein